MAISSSSSSSSSDNEVQNCSKCLESFKSLQKNFDSERAKHNKARLEIQGYELALESLESRILGHEKNELAWGEKYEFQNYELKCREIKINNLKMELEKVVKERDELKVKIEKWEDSSKGLDKLLNSQMSAKDKTGLGYGTQLNDMTNDRFSKADGYHAVPPPITGNFLTPRADISFAGLDELAIRKKIIESKTIELNTKTNETVGKTNAVNVEKPKSVYESVVPKPKINRDRVIIEDWNSDDENDVSDVVTTSPVRTNETQTVRTRVDKIGQVSQKSGIGFKKVKSCFVCKSTDHLIKDCNFYDKKSPKPKLRIVVNIGQRVVKPIWDNAKRVNHQKFSNKLKYPQARRTFVPSGVLTRTGVVNPVRPKVNPVRPNVSTVRPKVHLVRPNVSTARSYYTKPAFRPKDLKQDVKTFGVKNMTTAGTRAVANTGKGKMENALKKSRWGNPEIVLQDYVVVDSGCSSHMTGNKTYLSDYEDYNGGFVAFGSDPKGDKITGLENQLNHKVKIIRCDHRTEFKNYTMNELCAKNGIKREFSVARTPQQNGVAERKNRTLIEAARTMLANSLLPIPFWAEAVNTACYVLNRVLVIKPQNKTPYELLLGKSPSISFMRPFGCPLTILNTLDPLGKFDGKADEGYLLGYSTTSTQGSYVTGSSGKDKEPIQEYILHPIHPHRTRILVEDVVQAA
ncbi:retrovirus-related pol polyprotein from transposon TNT 1-94 [Tanacetum coccineum]